MVMEAKPHPLIHLEHQITVELVMIWFHIIPGLRHTFPNLQQELVAVLELLVHRDHLELVTDHLSWYVNRDSGG
jgi:hypothetical protein